MRRTYLDVPYEEKDAAKRLGARWDPEIKSWYVPDGVRLEPFARWVPPPGEEAAGPYDHWEPGPLLAAFAKRLDREPFVVLMRQSCWRCDQAGYAVQVYLHCDESDALALGYTDGPLAINPCDGEYAFELGGGAVATVSGLDRALRAYGQHVPHVGDRIATFKRRFSRTVGEAYMSQGCPVCDALWGDFPLSELSLRYVHRLAPGHFDDVELIRACDFGVD